MSAVRGVLQRPQGYVRLALCVLLPMGACMSLKSIPLWTMRYYYRDVIGVALAGGALTAFTLLAAGARGFNPANEMLFAAVYALITFTASMLYYQYHMHTDLYKQQGHKLEHSAVAIVLFCGFLLWIIDFVISAVHHHYHRAAAATAAADAPAEQV